MIRVLKDKRGFSHIKMACIILAVCMIFSVVFTYISLMITVSKTREDTQRVMDSFIIENAEVIYNSVKNGNNTTLSNSYNNRFRELVAAELGLSRSGSTLWNENSRRQIMFHYNNPITTNIRNGVLELQTRYEIAIPVNFAGRRVMTVRVPITVRSLYVLK